MTRAPLEQGQVTGQGFADWRGVVQRRCSKGAAVGEKGVIAASFDRGTTWLSATVDDSVTFTAVAALPRRVCGDDLRKAKLFGCRGPICSGTSNRRRPVVPRDASVRRHLERSKRPRQREKNVLRWAWPSVKAR